MDGCQTEDRTNHPASVPRAARVQGAPCTTSAGDIGILSLVTSTLNNKQYADLRSGQEVASRQSPAWDLQDLKGQARKVDLVQLWKSQTERQTYACLHQPSLLLLLVSAC